MFPSFVENPTDCKFEGQDTDEHIILLLRAHPITTLSWIIPAILVFLIPFYLPIILQMFEIDLSFIPMAFALVFLVINYLLVLVILFEGFLGWYFNVNILTNKKLIDIDFYSILLKHVDQAKLDDVQESSSRVGGVFGLFFNFGDVIIQTAASKEGIDYKNVPHPDRAADIILDNALRTRP